MTVIASPELVSPEFLSLCKAQLRLLTQQLAESTAALYISAVTDAEAEQTNFVPVVSYPEPLERWMANFERATPWSAAGNALMLPATVEDQVESRLEVSDDVLECASGQILGEGKAPAWEGVLPMGIFFFQWPDVLESQSSSSLMARWSITDVVVWGCSLLVRPDRGVGRVKERQ